MIDYEKLILAHELCQKTRNYFFTSEFGNDGDLRYELISAQLSEKTYECLTIDELITKLQELTQQKRVYEVGSTWWTLDHTNLPFPLIITERNKDFYRHDQEWFASNEELIQAQIEYWQGLLPKECEHESDGLVYTSNPVKYRCKKCNEFFLNENQ